MPAFEVDFVGAVKLEVTWHAIQIKSIQIEYAQNLKV